MIRSLALALLLLTLSWAAVAEERILSFDSAIQIERDGGMQVTETIRVTAEGSRIRRGIYRDFPTDYSDRLGNRYRVGFEVVAVTRDGVSDAHREERLSNGVRVYIGRADYFLPNGEYEYRLTYRTDHQLGFFADHDELYWNVTGNGWSFAIDRASATVSMPPGEGRRLSAIEGYTGAAGSTERAYDAQLESAERAGIHTTRPLGPGEGLTLVLSWPKGWIEEPSTFDKLRYVLAQNAGLEVALAGFLGVLLYFLYAWNKAGRDPAPGVIFPHYTPPERLSPASVRYVSRMGYDNKAFTAAIINLAVKGYLHIEEAKKVYTLRRIEGASAQLAPGEGALLGTLFSRDDHVVLKNENHAMLQRAMAAHRISLDRNYNRVYFRNNYPLLIPGILILAATAGLVFLIGQLSAAIVVVLVAAVLLIPLFHYLLKAPTRLGRRLLDEIEGFKSYLELAEKDELALRNPPEKTPQLFEAYLPYALALGIEQRWAEKFAGVFARLSEQTGTAYSPAWYQGRWSTGNISSHVGRFTSDVTHSLGSAISSASTPPGSSSGGGGGSSGGGGGGGGGGGW